jgi:CubicO group peptidase (beta-lactamase class C family)
MENHHQEEMEMRTPSRKFNSPARIASTLVIGLAAALPLYGDEPAYDFEPLRSALKEAVANSTVPSASVLLIKDGRVIFKEAYGWADTEKKRPFTTSSITHQASSTKWVSAATVMALVAEGKISLHDPLGRYFEGFKDMPVKDSSEPGNPTIRHSFSMTSGIPRSENAMEIIRMPLMEGVKAYQSMAMTLDYAPGSKYTYGNASMQIGGAIVEKVSGRPFADYMKDKILDPLGMTDTTFNPQGEQLSRVARVHRKVDGELKPTSGFPDGNIRHVIVAGGLYSTLDDYGAFLQMLVNEGVYQGRRVLPAVAARELVRDQTGPVEIVRSPYRDQIGYSLGAAILEKDEQGNPLMICDGGAFGTLGWIDNKAGIQGVFHTSLPLRSAYEFIYATVPSLSRAAVLGVNEPAE